MKYAKIFIYSVSLCLSGFLLTCAPKIFNFPLNVMRQPPGGLAPEQVPLFVSFGTDDNPYSGLPSSGGSGGMHWLTEMFDTRQNHDGTQLHYSFYPNSIYLTSAGMENGDLVKQSYLEAVAHGHEIGVHTHTHPHGRKFKVAQWTHEMQLCIDHLTGIGVARDQLIGFRTPFLEYGDATLTAAQETGFTYDCSLEEGFQKDQDGRNYVWPYQLDHGAPGNSATYKLLDLPLVKEHPNLWELPVYAFIVPPDESCQKYGIPPGLRARLHQANDYFELDQGKITGMDWNLWFEFGLSAAEFVATLKYTLDQRLEGNRAPMMVGVHSAIYADKSEEYPPQTTVEERREAFREFLDYAVSKPEVRVVSSRELLAWLKSPAPLTTQNRSSAGFQPAELRSGQDARATYGLGAGFRFSVYGQKIDPGPQYWARVAKEMSARFPGSHPEAIWIIGKVNGRGTELPFPVPKDIGDPLITGSDQEDKNEAALELFDKLNFRVWLQVEPRFASPEKLIHLVLQRYQHHRCVVGIGIDVEWNKSTNPDAGDPVSDAEARAWLAAARSHNPNYRLFLKHWETQKMPPTIREGLLFIDDSQILPSLEAMVDEFAQWGKAFAPAPVAFQYGYPSDRPWWIKLNDPPKEIGDRILKAIPNTEALFWVNFSVLEVFPPQ